MAAMPPVVRRRFDAHRGAPLTWRVGQEGKPSLVTWHDSLIEDLGPDPDGTRFERIAERMLSGNYYPLEVIEFFGDWKEEGRHLRAGDRVLQRMKVGQLTLWGMTEIFVAERSQNQCRIGYVTTQYHHGRGIWQATLTRAEGRLSIEVEATSGPGSWLFWLGLPVARAMQRQAWGKALASFLAE